jgi:hypothetical protein
MDDFRSMITHLNSICELLHEAIELMQQPETIDLIKELAPEISNVAFSQAGATAPANADEICRMALLMATVEQDTSHPHWPTNIVEQAKSFVQMNVITPDSGDTAFEQALGRLKLAHKDCLAMSGSMPL